MYALQEEVVKFPKVTFVSLFKNQKLLKTVTFKLNGKKVTERSKRKSKTHTHT